MNPRIWYNQVRKQFAESIYDDVLGPNHIHGGEVNVKYDGFDCYGFKLKKGLYTYFIPSEHIGELPFKVLVKDRFAYKNEVLHFIQEFESVKITPDAVLSFRELVDDFNSFEHSNSIDWTLAKIVTLGAFIDRLNVRLITGQGMGKDSLVNSLIELTENGSNIYKATLAKLEYELRNQYIVINEVSTSKKEDKELFEQFFLEAGAFANSYLARSRAVSGGAGKKERYDISKTSIIVLQNTPEYYLETNKDLFETVFTRAVYHRFFPVYLEGYLTEEFHDSFDAQSVLESNRRELVDWVKTLYYYREQPLTPLDTDYKFNDDELRFKLNFDKIARLVEWYANDNVEQQVLLDRLYNQFLAYKAHLKDLGVVYY